MEKIRLKDQTEVNVEGGMTENHFEVVVTGYDKMKELYSSLTEENLSEFEILNDAGLVCAVLKNKKVSTERRFTLVEGTQNIRVLVDLEDIDIRDVQLAQIAASSDYLVMMAEM